MQRPLEPKQYVSIRYTERLADAGIEPSVGSVGDSYDNAQAESFFASLECELLARRRFKTKTEGRMAVFTWIEAWYNRQRRYSALNDRSPVNFEEKHRQKIFIEPSPPAITVLHPERGRADHFPDSPHFASENTVHPASIGKP